MMKLIYGQIFQFLIDIVNGNSSNSSTQQCIVLLDIPGFGEYHFWILLTYLIFIFATSIFQNVSKLVKIRLSKCVPIGL